MSQQVIDCKVSEKTLIWVVFLINYVTMFEFVIINPLSPDYIVELGIMSSDVGILAGTFSLTSALAGFAVVTFIDNHDRKKVLKICLVGLIISNIATIFSYDFKSFLIAKIIAGLFAGTLTTTGLAIITDNIPVERRGAALGKAMSSFPIVAAIGIPLGLELSHYSGYWETAFAMNLLFELSLFVFILKKIPTMDNHLHHLLPITALTKYKNIFFNKIYLLAFLTNFISLFAGFCLIPNFANFFIFNLDYPREKLGLLFMIGGCISFFGVRFLGKLSDKHNHSTIISYLVLTMLFALYFRFISENLQLPILIFFVLFMLSLSSRNVVFSSLCSKIPSPHDRASFFSIYNVSLNIGSGMGAFCSSIILKEGANFQLINIEKLAIISMIATSLIPLLVITLEKKLKKI